MPEPETPRPRVSATRIGIWIVVGGIGLYMVISGLLGVLAGGS